MAIKTYTVTVANPGAGNRYYIDGVLQQTVNLIEGYTYRFDQSDNTNGGHPFKFSTTSNGTHGGGSEYTTGVTINGTPGQAGSYTEIAVAIGAPQLYYYCQYHSGMGGQANTVDSSVMRVFTVTKISTGSGNKYVIDGVQQATVVLAEGYTYRFDQSDNSNSGHPYRFSTTSDGTHGGGSTYTTGVTTSGTPGQPGAYTQIAVAASAPQLYYYCTVHSGMGGSANTVSSNTWGVLKWNENSWGDQDGIDVPLTGLSTTTSLGTVISGSDEGWGADAWGDNNWGENAVKVPLDGLSMSAALGPEGWGVNSFGNGQWGDPFVFDVASIIGITGQTLSADVGDITLSRIDMVFGITAPAAIGTGIGSLGFSNGTDHSQGLASLTVGSAVGSISPADVMGLTGQVIKTEVNSGGVNTGDTTAFTLSGVTMSAEVGSISPADVVGLTGVTFAADEGAISPTNMTVGLTGQDITVNLNTVGLGTIGYQDVDITGNTSYTDVNHAA